MSQIQNQTSVSPVRLKALSGDFTIIDVRKPVARATSGLAIPGAFWRHPFDAVNWADEFKAVHVVVYCVHGHEVSLAVRGYLSDVGIDAVIIEGGFEAWRHAVLPVEQVADINA